MKIVSIKRGLAIVLAVLLVFPTRVAIASEGQVSKVAEEQGDHLLKDTEEISDSKEEILDEEEKLDKEDGLEEEKELDKKEDLDEGNDPDEEDDLDKEDPPLEGNAGDKKAEPDLEDPSAEDESTEEVGEMPADPDDDGDKERGEVGASASDKEADAEEDPSLGVDEDDLVEEELSVRPLALEEEDEIITGTCGDGLTWILDKGDGTLRIDGDGDMDDIPSGSVSPWYENNMFIKHIVIEDGVIGIGSSAFSMCSNLISINIPDSVMFIRGEAFNGCLNLTSVDIPNSVIHIGAGAFRDCINLTNINIPDSVTNIDAVVFEGCASLTSIDIPDSITTIVDNMFQGCTGLTSIDIPDSVTTIGEFAFSKCTNLTSVNIPSSVTAIMWGTFERCTDLTSINIPDSVTTIGKQAFEGCSSLTSINIPNSVTTIGQFAFNDCTGLTSIEIPENIEEIEYGAFFGCSRLKSIKIQNGVSNIGDAVFVGCNSLTEIDIPGSVEAIRTEAFANCDNLENVNLSEGILEIDANAFQCANLTDIVIPASVRTIGEQAFGYYFDQNTLDIERKADFIIMGISGSAAEQYAIDNDFTFIALDTLVDPVITTTEIPGGVRYGPYEALIENSSTYSWNTVTYSLVDGALPSGIELDPHNGKLYGVPMETGTSTFTVRMENGFSRFPDREKIFSITTIDNTDRNVADYTDVGYEITKRVQDMTIDLAYDQTVVSRGSFDEFTNVFIDGVELVRDVDYTAEEGSTRITIMRQTFQRFASIGIHTISIEFRTRDKGLLKRAIQNYEIKATNSGNGSSGSGSGGRRDRKNSSGDGAPANVIMVIFDPKKGYVHTVTGIIPREWVGYSHWVKDEKGWRLVYADGTEACGYMVEQADGDALEQILWEMVAGAWYAFGADGYLKSGWVFDYQLSGWYFLSAEGGMHTGWYHDPQDDHDYYLDQATGRISAGWRRIDGKWYYFKENITTPTWKFDQDTRTWAYDPMNINKPYGAMYRREWTPDRYYVDDNGVWDPNIDHR